MKQLQKYIAIVILIAFVSTSVPFPAGAQVSPLPFMPQPGSMVHLSPLFTPAQLTGITIHPDNALQFDFLINKGDQVLDNDQKKVEYKKLVKYFLASLTIPDEDQWVNLSPYEKDRIIKEDFGKTEMGRDLLAQDYLLKQITSSVIYPEGGLGKEFWDKVYQRAWIEYHTTNIPVNTFNKVWIVPDQALVYESGNSAYILKSHLKVMLEEDYLSLEKHTGITTQRQLGDMFPHLGGGTCPQAGCQQASKPLNVKASQVNNGPTSESTNTLGSQVIRATILPELEREVNEGKNFASLRQMYSGMVLATWYKQELKNSLLGKIYADKAKVLGVTGFKSTDSGVIASTAKQFQEQIYQQYLLAFKKGVFNYIKDDVDKYTNETVPRKYFSGGFERLSAAMAVKIITSANLAMMPQKEEQIILANLQPTNDIAEINLDAAMSSRREVIQRILATGVSALLPKGARAQENDVIDLNPFIHDISRPLSDAEVADIKVSPKYPNNDKPDIELELNLSIVIKKGKTKVTFETSDHIKRSGIVTDIIFPSIPILVDVFVDTGEATYILSVMPLEGRDAAMITRRRLLRDSLIAGAMSLVPKLAQAQYHVEIINVQLFAHNVSFPLPRAYTIKLLKTPLYSQNIQPFDKWALKNYEVIKKGTIVTFVSPDHEQRIGQVFEIIVPNKKMMAPNQVAVFVNSGSISFILWFDIGWDAAMNAGDKAMAPGGIDFNAANLNLQIKRDGKGRTLPLAQQDMAQLSQIQGFEPEIIKIKPAINVPIITELQKKLQPDVI